MLKSITHLLLALLYFGAVVVCILIGIKPGASVFYYKMTLDNQSVIPDAGRAFRYDLKLSPFIFRTRGILVYEEGKQLNQTDGYIVANVGSNSYSLSESTNGSVHIYFAASDNSDPITNGRKYSLYLPLNFISRPMGMVYLVILLPGLAWFLYFALAVPDHRKTFLQSPAGILFVLDCFFEYFPKFIKPNTRLAREQIKSRTVYWKRLFTITILVAYFYVFMEWIFFATMPSFMSLLSVFNKLEVFLLSGLVLSLLCIAVIAIFIIIDIYALSINFPHITNYIGVIIPTALTYALALLMIDNFTYTVFKFGISNASGIWRGGYGLLFFLLSVYVYVQMLKIFGLRENAESKKKSAGLLFYASLGLVVASFGLALARINYTQVDRVDANADGQRAANHPNIILLGSDGLNANNLSVYGYYRDTTPRLRELALTSLVAENAFTNAGTTAGSIISIMTSKLPTQTRVLYPPDILTGLDAFQHLPGLLKGLGYKTIELGVPYYVDAYSYNLQESFDMVNNRTKPEGQLTTLGRKLGYENTAYFLSRIRERISERILHITYIRNMQNPYRIVTEPVPSIEDKEKINQLIDLLDQSEVPLFAHLHLMGTHGGIFTPAMQVFSKDETQSAPWMDDFYDDTILAFDDYVGKVIDHLKTNGQLENTILIIYTDHNPMWQVNERVPLIIHFPGDIYTGRIYQNVQNMDIAPTIMNFLGLSPPDWMSGESLLNGNPDNTRLIFSMGTSKVAKDEHDVYILDPERVKPPFYQFSYINIKDCQKWYTYDLKTFIWSSGDVSGYTHPCDENSLHSFEEIKQALPQRLTMDGFDISSLVK
jgi:glucan phosphoethanolaminetransferase (alkaline phosphatase superfamily)